MNFNSFTHKYRQYPLIKSTCFALEKSPNYVRRLVSEWVKKGWLLELRRGMYLVNQQHVLSSTERFNLANSLYEPSYVSLEAALSFHGVIPEAVLQTTSVSTRKTARFGNALGAFTYSQIKKELFWGYVKQTLGQRHALIATPEKALLDLIYLRRGDLKQVDQIFESLRLDNLKPLSSRSILLAARRFNSDRMLEIGKEIANELRRRRV